jgi:putative alpha-1,2-mannosidase
VIITAPGATTSTYVRGMSVNGGSWSDDWVPAGLVTGGGGPAALSFTMGSSPNTSWGRRAADPVRAAPNRPAGTPSAGS